MFVYFLFRNEQLILQENNKKELFVVVIRTFQRGTLYNIYVCERDRDPTICAMTNIRTRLFGLNRGYLSTRIFATSLLLPSFATRAEHNVYL